MMNSEKALDVFHQLYKRRGWTAFAFQEEMLQAYLDGYSGLLNAPTGSGKTLAAGLPILINALVKEKKVGKGFRALWITPIRALAPEIESSLSNAAAEIGLSWRIENRTGDTSSADKAKQKKSPPEVLITTPESLHVLMAQKGYSELFENLDCVVVDEWHELLSSKRGVQMELALSRLRAIAPELRTWGISATIGNLDEALQVLLGFEPKPWQLIRASIEKNVDVNTLIPDQVEKFPWAGHMGLKLAEMVVPIVESSRTTLIFTNTRNQSEVWYQHLLKIHPDWAGQMALHHGSIGAEARQWVEQSLHEGKLKLVVCTSSLDLGVDFRPVETVIQIGSPKGVARFAQRAGRSGHQPGKTSRIYLLPTHSLELLESAGFKYALKNKIYESRIPVVRAFDVLVQYLVTLAVGEGFYPDQIFNEVSKTYCFHSMTRVEFDQLLAFITTGGETLHAYEEFSRVNVVDGKFIVTDRRTAMRHRLSIGTIAGDSSMNVKFLNGKRLGSIEESFITRLNPGDVFVFGGKLLELSQIRGMDAIVKPSNKKSAVVPSWQGGRMPLSSEISKVLREKLSGFTEGDITDPEIEALIPLLEVQRNRSALPRTDELLIEILASREGHHLFVYPFDGRLVHEGMAMLLAYRFSKDRKITFSIAMNDYGFELLTDQEFDYAAHLKDELFSTQHLTNDIFASTNYTEIARRRFRDIASISGLVFKGFPHKMQKTIHLQANSNLFYEVFSDYDKNNLLLRQAFEEAMYFQLEELRLRNALVRMQSQRKLIQLLDRPSPFCFPIMVDRLREKMTNESIEDRVQRMIAAMEKA
jgi:ATP-dependent helicase Lhr and Lhr-like helicase